MIFSHFQEKENDSHAQFRMYCGKLGGQVVSENCAEVTRWGFRVLHGPWATGRVVLYWHDLDVLFYAALAINAVIV